MEPELFFVINLKNLAAIKLAKIFFNEERLLMVNYFKKPTYSYLTHNLDSIIKEIPSKVDKYQIPSTLKNHLTNAILYMLKEYEYWKEKYYSIFHMCTISNLIDSIEITYKGKIDVAKTVANLLNIDTISLYDKFCLSCRFCIEDKVVRFGNELSTEYRLKFHLFEKSTNVKNYWIYYLKWDTSLDFADEQKLVECVQESLMKENLLAVEYFYNKLSSQNQELVFALLQNQGEYLSDEIFNFFFSNNLINKTDMLQTKTFCLFKAILKNCMWNQNFSFLLNSYKQFLTEEEVFRIAYLIVEYMEYYPKLNELQVFFRKFHHHFSAISKKDELQSCILHVLCKIEDTVSLNMMLNEFSFEQKQYFFKHGVMGSKNYDMMKFYIEQVYKTDDEVAKLKSDLLSIQEDSLGAILLGKPEAKIFKMVKDKVSPSEDEWEQFNIDVSKNKTFLDGLCCMNFKGFLSS